MAGIPQNTSQARKQTILNTLPDYDWSVIKAGIAAGYSPKYAETTLTRQLGKDDRFCKAILAKRRASEAGTQDERDKGLQCLHKLRDAKSTSDRDKIAAIKEEGRICGWHSETRILETRERQIQLSEAEKAVAVKASLLLLDTRRLPDGSYGTEPPESCNVHESTPGE